ncbi:hypothetical protein OKA05_06060 [Luteolibacter arcticus]|uniref:HEAT repeat domain-containing protein n=1 Tax=Luteolibacter arcticus TaxID=1581411 RepID=A0ABT3GES6_9BACT|nr:hypothetical protein [Luteolibacter arcticus]MCW1922109.1 hypothetical protein [Luteolibacter arcticus]
MIGKAYLLVPLALTVGFACGFGSRHFHESPPQESTATQAASAPGTGGQTSSGVPIKSRSTDTVESLLGLDDHSLYQRLALWLLDADETGIRAFFERYQNLPEADEDVLKLLFARWTKVDPAGAIRAATATYLEGLAWWAWTLNDPELAVREVPEDFFDEVMQALARFHPERVEAALAAHPEFSIRSDREEIARELAASDPGAALQLLREHDGESENEVIEEWTRQDPHAALAWLEEHPDRTDGSFEEGFLEALEKEHPELLAELAARARSGKLKWELEGAAFRHLVKEDPAAALAMAEATESLRVKAERLAALGREAIAADPQQALARFAEVFQTLPDAADRTAYVRFADDSDNGGDGGDAIAGLDDFVEELVATDALAAMDTAVRHGTEMAKVVADEWSSEDVDGLSTWLLEQPPGPIRDQGVNSVVHKLANSSDFAAAIRWESEISGADARSEARRKILTWWVPEEPDAAKAWLESADPSEWHGRYRWKSSRSIRVWIAPATEASSRQRPLFVSGLTRSVPGRARFRQDPKVGPAALPLVQGFARGAPRTMTAPQSDALPRWKPLRLSRRFRRRGRDKSPGTCWGRRRAKFHRSSRRRWPSIS